MNTATFPLTNNKGLRAGVIKGLGGFSQWSFGIIFPLIILIVEMCTGMCAATFFDPIPTFWHTLLVVSVPLTNLYTLKWAKKQGNEVSLNKKKTLSFMRGSATVVSIFYGLLYLYLLPLSVIALIAFGMGLLSLTPVFCAVVTLCINTGHRYQTNLPANHRGLFRWGIILALVTLTVLEFPSLWTRVGLSRASSDSSQIADSGLSQLRFYHSSETLQRACYEGRMGTNAGTDISGWMIRGGAIFTAIFSNSWPLDNLDSDQTRRIYYQVTGEAFNTREPEFWRGRFMGGTFRHPAAVTEIDWDPHIGEGQVGTRVKGLSMKNSRIDAHLDPLSELSYQEWTIDFKNISSVDREARMQLQLPYGGTVSRVTLWVHGEPQEAAFASRSKVKKAYQQIAVAQRRDPLLVTACGPDRVMVQCFPILPGKEMKIRLGITAPMTKGQVSFPKILERNFRFNEDLRHQIWAQSTDPFQLNDERAMKGKHQYELQSSLNDLQSSQLQWSTDHTAVGSVWCHDPFATTGEEILVRTAELTDDLACERLAIVVDGSRSLKKDENVLKTALARILKEHSHIRIFLANEKVAVLSTPSMIDQIKFKGGHSNGPALLKALQWVGSVEESAVVWLHGAQPIDFAEDRQLEQFFERSSTRIPLYSVPLTGGSHRILEKLFQHNTVHAAPQMLDLEADLPAYIEEFLSGKRKSWKWERRSSGKEPTIIPKVWDQLARFWAADQISQMESSQKDDKEMIDTAAHYQVITAYSGAVVLEEAAQYKRFGLEQVDTQTTPTVPTVPEPSTSLLIILATASLLSKRNRTTRMGRNNSQ